MILCLIAQLLAAPPAIYINNVYVDTLPQMELRNVTVRVDATGALYIDAPNYRVEVVDPDTGVATPAAPSSAAAPISTARSATAPYSAPTPAPSSAPTPALPAASSGAVAANGVAVGRWWLVSEDNASKGQVVDIVINGTTVRQVRSGEAQVLVDVGSYLMPGGNVVVVNAKAGSPSGGPLTVYVGEGVTKNGVLQMDNPPVRLTRRSIDDVAASRSFTVTVP